VNRKAERVRVTVADDHPLFRRGLTETLKRRPDIELLAEDSNGADALASIREHAPDIAILDVQMPGLSGLEVLNAVERDGIETRIVLLTGFTESGPLYEAMALGAGAYLAKDAEGERICEAILSVARGATVIGEDFQAGLASEIRMRERGDRPVLTDREREVLSLTAEGGSVADVAAGLHLSEATVKTHLHHTYEKLDVSDRAAAVAQAMRFGLIE
jgi:two-component system, NarL family, nitrate/nitrite response regulator NarL